MRDALRFVSGAIKDSAVLPVLSHVAFRAGRVYASNGRVTLSAPVPELSDLECTAPAARILPAVGLDDDSPLAVTGGDAGSPLSIKRMKLRARIPTGPISAFPLCAPPESGVKRIATPLLALCAKLAPFMGSDATHPWACGLALDHRSVAATNNVTMAVAPLRKPWPFAPSILPSHAVAELLRIAEEPSAWGHDGVSVTAVYEEHDRWLRALLLNETWPKDPLDMIRGMSNGAKYTPVPKGLVDAINAVRPLCLDERAPVVILEGTTVSTPAGEVGGEVSGFKKFPVKCAFRVEPLLEVLKLAEEIDFSRFPRVPWRGQGVEGAIAGVHV